MRKWIRWLVFSGLAVLATWFFFCIPGTLFRQPYSTVLYAEDGSLLSAITASDGQWRFPAADSLPDRFCEALIQFEDRHFYHHNGVYLPSIVRAIWQNLTRQQVVSGASTLTMQVIRMSRSNPPRTWWEKLTEMMRAMRLESGNSKKEILALYAAHAPFGGNVVGLDAASWRYFGRTPDQLSWAEAATLAVLPNAPSLIFPGKNQERLMKKRNRLLQQLMEANVIDEHTYELSLLEPIPAKPYALPQRANHLLHTASKQFGEGKRFHTTIRKSLQEDVSELVRRQSEILGQHLIHNAAVLVIEVRTGHVLAYVGNAPDEANRYGNQVDVIPAPRSTGSILKPILYAAMLQDGRILPDALIPDIPVDFDGFAPKNYSEKYDGAVPASQALSRSLNVPSVFMLRDYGYPRFYHLLRELHFSQMNQGADHYGLSLILGGAEASLWDITNAYAGMSRTLNHYFSEGHVYTNDLFGQGSYLSEADQPGDGPPEATPLLQAASIWSTYQALLRVNRPETELGWEAYSNSTPVAWKTGTSFGNRDAWAVGTTPEYVVGVWVGNADGQGRPELTGVTAAAPLLFQVFDLLPQRSWFQVPYDEMEKVAVCTSSGMRAGPHCPDPDTLWVPRPGLESAACPFHQSIQLDPSGKFRVGADCLDPDHMISSAWFTLPPLQEHFYMHHHPEYKPLPAFLPGCGEETSRPIALIYPKGDARIYIPRNLSGQRERIVLEATHRRQGATLFWHINNTFIGQTRDINQLEIQYPPGRYLLTIEDEEGNSLTQWFEIIER